LITLLVVAPQQEREDYVPFIFTRAGEITQLRGVDVVRREGIDALRLTPEAGTIKTGATRTIPIHEHLIAQGFLDFVKTRGDGPLFYNPENISKGSADPTNPRRPRAVKTRERLATWVRKIGVKDPRCAQTMRGVIPSSRSRSDTTSLKRSRTKSQGTPR
jgi:hypothetical protein